MNLVRYGMIGFLLGLGQQGSAGMIQDTARFDLRGDCSKLDAKDVAFDDKGNLRIDLSSLPPLTGERRKFTCQLKIPYTADSKAMEGTWQLNSSYKAAHGSRMLSTVRFSPSGSVGEAKIWTLEEPATGSQAWNETWSVPLEEGDARELKITWTHELKIPNDDTQTSTGCSSPSFQLKELTLGPGPANPEPTPAPTPAPVE